MINKAQGQLQLIQSFSTSGARAVEFFTIADHDFVAVAQLAEDIPDGQIGMNEGNSDIDLIIWQANQAGFYEECQRLPVPGGEDVEYFSIDGRHFLATASIRTGKGPYNYNASSVIFELVEGKFVIFQSFQTFGAKQWRYFSIPGRHFLALAQGLKVPGLDSLVPGDSTIFEWDGNAFSPFQTVQSAWGYNFQYFELSGAHFLAYADFVEPSILLQWNGDRFVHFQSFPAKGGRAFLFFQVESNSYLALADIQGDSIIYQWDSESFREHQVLDGPGGRELALIQDGSNTYLVLVKFIHGTPKAPITELESIIYRMEHGLLKEEKTFVTHGATDAAVVSRGSEIQLFICESLTKDVRFRTDSHLYRFRPHHRVNNVDDVRGAGKQSPEFLDLYTAYASSPQGIGSQLVNFVSKSTASNDLLVATSTEMLLFPGNIAEPSYINIRKSNRGFKELAAISHLGPAVASLIQMSAVDNVVWRNHARNLLAKVVEAQKANTTSLWRDELRVAAFAGREEAIAAMIDYACAVTVQYLEAILEDQLPPRADLFRKQYLEATDSALRATIPMNAVMIATFFLVGLDISFRIRIWLNNQNINWQTAMVLVVGQQGRETAGVTLSSNSVAQGILQCSDLELPASRIFIAPHGPKVNLEGSEAKALREYETGFRSLWNRIHATVGLGETMFEGYPVYAPQLNSRPIVNESTVEVSEMPRILGPDDWFTLTTRMRMVLEDARQLLSGCVIDYAAEQLRQRDNDLTRVTVPGLDSYPYVNAANTLRSSVAIEAPPVQPRALRQEDTLLGIPSGKFTQFLAPPTMCPVAGGEIAYYEEGSGSWTNVWVHGLPLDSRSWGAQRSHFASKHRNIYMDLRGYGNSSKFAAGARNVTQTYCDDLLSLLDHLNLGPVNLIGFASAGHVALRFASQHPDRLRRLVVINGSPCFRQRDDWRHGFDEKGINKFIDAASEGGIEALTAMVLNRGVVFKDLNIADGMKLKRWFESMSFNAGLDTVLKFFTDISFDDDRKAMADISSPTLLITGSMGEEVPSGTGAFLRQGISNSRLVELAGADHFLFATKPYIVNPIIDEFLDG